MKFNTVSVSNYRNIELARLDVDAPRVFLHGNNGQGKTNLLEALGLATALRPFRTHENRKVIGPCSDYSEVAYEIDHEDLGETQLRARIKKMGKEVWIDGGTDETVIRFCRSLPDCHSLIQRYAVSEGDSWKSTQVSRHVSLWG